MNQEKRFVIGIAGGSGSGKTTFLRALLDHFSEEQIALVSQDNYYLPREAQQKDPNGVLNFDLPTSIDRAHLFQDLSSLVRGNSIEKLEYNFNNPDWTPATVMVKPAPVIVVEGLFIFHYEEVRSSLDCMVYIDAHPETRLERRIRRDFEERGYPESAVRYQWHHHVRPAEEHFMEPYKPSCHLVVDNTHSFDDGLEELKSIIRHFLGK